MIDFRLELARVKGEISGLARARAGHTDVDGIDVEIASLQARAEGLVKAIDAVAETAS